MSRFLYRITPTRPDMLVTGPTEQEADIVAEHFGYLRELVDAGTVLLAGRTLTEDEQAFGIVVFAAGSVEAARRRMQDDPAVSRGVMRAELFPFRVALWSAMGPSEGAGAG